MLAIEERFWGLVRRCRHRGQCRRCCWEWQGRRLATGYGIFFIDGEARQEPAHRLAIEFTHGALLLNHREILRCFGPLRSFRHRRALFLGTHR